MKRFMILVMLLGLVFTSVGTYSVLQARSLEAESLPDLVFLGEGPEFTVPPGYNFIVKKRNPFRFVWEPGPTYLADRRTRVWRSSGTGGAPPAVYHESIVIGPVDPGCIIQYVAIDDDIDDRINYFRLNGNIIHEMPQGMVSQGQFVVDSAGVLSYEANDSIGMYLNVCEVQVTAAPTATSTATSTVTPLPSVLTATPTATTSVTPTPVGTPSPTPLPTATPHERACARINFEVSGDVARTGTYVLQGLSGRTHISWYALDGWESSPWFHDLDIAFPEVYVQVFYYPNDGSESIEMQIINHAPGKPYGWLAGGMCHAIEVGWP